jgi:hypothetical protein
MDMVVPAGHEALNIFSSETITPSPRPLPEGRGIYKDRGPKKRIRKGQTHKAINTKPRFQQVNQGDGE